MAATASALERGACFFADCARPVIRNRSASQQGVHCRPLGLESSLRKQKSSRPLSPASSSHTGFVRAAPLSQVSSSVTSSAGQRWLQATVHARQSSRLSMMAETQVEEVFFDGGPHWGDLAVNLVFGISVLWLPLTVAAIARGLLARYRFTDQRVTIIGGFTGSERRDFSYKDVKDVKYVPRFLGDWGDLVISLNNGDQIECQRIPKFKEIAAFIEKQAAAAKPGGVAARAKA